MDTWLHLPPSILAVRQVVLIQLCCCFCSPWRQDPGVQVQQLQTRTLVGSEHRELRQASREGLPPRPPLRLLCTGAGEHPSEVVKPLRGRGEMGGGGQVLPSVGILGGKKTAQTHFTLVFVKKTPAKSSSVVCFPCRSAVAMETYEQPPLSSPSLRLLFIASPSAGRGHAAESSAVTTESNNLYSCHATSEKTPVFIGKAGVAAATQRWVELSIKVFRCLGSCWVFYGVCFTFLHRLVHTTIISVLILRFFPPFKTQIFPGM